MFWRFIEDGIKYSIACILANICSQLSVLR